MLGIVERGDHARRLVKRVVERRHRRLDPLAVDLDTVLDWVGLGAEFANDGAVNRDAPFDNPTFRLAPGRQARPRENFL